jgi:hypothetical protein
VMVLPLLHRPTVFDMSAEEWVAVAAALAAWQEAALVGTADRLLRWCECDECSGDAPRWRLHQTLVALPAWARPHLFALVLPVDRYYLRRTSPALPASPDSDRAWWQRRRLWRSEPGPIALWSSSGPESLRSAVPSRD